MERKGRGPFCACLWRPVPDYRDRPPLEERVTAACERILAERGQVSTLEMLLGIQFIHHGHINQWKMSLIPYLEKATLTNHENWGLALAAFHRWGESRGLRRVLAEYRMKNRTGEQYLRFTDTCDKVVEDLYRVAYATHGPPPPTRERRVEPTVWEVMRDSECGGCGEMVYPGAYIFRDKIRALCLPCAKLDQLAFLPSGDAGLTRLSKQRTIEASAPYAVVMRFNQGRSHYQRVGILVREKILDRTIRELEHGDEPGGVG